MSADTLKLIFSYTTAVLVILGGGAFLFATRGDPTAESTRLAIVGFMGSAITFVFTSEVATRATRAAQSAIATGAATATATPPIAPETVNPSA